MYYFQTSTGTLRITPVGGRWQASFNGVVLNEFGRPEDAATALSNGTGTMPALRALFEGVGLPAGVDQWQRDIPSPGTERIAADLAGHLEAKPSRRRAAGSTDSEMLLVLLDTVDTLTALKIE